MLFKKVIGNQNIKELFSKALSAKQLGNAYLFSGTDGIGKKLFAIELAKAINCLNPGQSLPCNNCINCTRIENMNYPDFLLIEPESNQIKILQIRTLIKETNYLPVEANKRVVIIDNAHLMNASSANTFLKTLEDSSEHSIFILITSALHALPETILSRCQIIKFSPLSNQEICEILKNKNLTYDLNLISNLASGSVTNAIKLTNKFNTALINEFYTKFNELSLSQTNKIFEFTDYLGEKFSDLTDILIIFKIFFLDVIRFKLKQEPKLYNSNEQDFFNYQKVIGSFASKTPLSVTFKKFNALNNLEKQLTFNINKKLATENLVLELVP